MCAPALREQAYIMAPKSVSKPNNRLLATLPKQERRQFFSNLKTVPLSLRQVIYEAGAPLKKVYFIEQGVASILTDLASGAKIEVGMIGYEGVVGVAAMLGRTTSTQQIMVQVPGSALQMSVAQCRAAFDQSAAVRVVMLRYFATLFDLASQTAACNRLHTIEQRCARWLLMAHDRLHNNVLPMTHEFLASMLGVRRAGVTATARELQNLGLIRYHHGQVTIVDRESLEALACECYHIVDRDMAADGIAGDQRDVAGLQVVRDTVFLAHHGEVVGRDRLHFETVIAQVVGIALAAAALRVLV
jgi:CRP-like cAMP-binding protein